MKEFTRHTLKIAVALLTAIGIGMNCHAEVTPAEAIAAAKDFFVKKSVKRSRANNYNTAAFKIKSENDAFYNVGREGGGFVLVAKGSNNPDFIIGYSDNGTFDGNSAQSQYLTAALAAQSESIDLQSSLYGDITAVEPLLGDIMWGQDEPYNLQCPTWKEIDERIVVDKNCPTGCVATAMGQIMAYHKFPAAYDWSVILPDYASPAASAASKNEVAKLLHDIGVNIEAKYGMTMTEATLENVVAMIPSTMGYSRAMTMWDVDYMSPASRRILIQQELLAGRPVYVGGEGDGGGHAFVCDGIDGTGFLHINWGWEGESNGYFHPLVLAPSGNQGTGAGGSHYSNRVVYITDIRAPKSGEIAGQQIYFQSLEPLDVSGNNASLAMSLIGISLSGTPQEVNASNYDFAAILADNDGNKISRIAAAYSDGKIKLEVASLNNGIYRLYPAYSVKGTDEWKYLLPRPEAAPYLNLTVDNGTLAVRNSFSTDAERAFQSSGLNIPATLDPWGSNEMTITVGNCGRSIANNRLALRFTDETTGSQSHFMELTNHNLSLAYGQEERFSFDITPVFFWRDDKVQFASENANIAWDANHKYTVDVYVSDNSNYTHLASSTGHNIASQQLSLNSISDSNIKKAYEKFDLDKDNILSDYELWLVTDLSISNCGATKIPGFANFRMLKNLTITNAPRISEIDFTGKEALYTVALYNMDILKSIELTDKPRLHSVYLSDMSKMEKVTLESLPSLSSFNLTGGNNLSIEAGELPLVEYFEVNGTVASSKFGDMPMLKSLRLKFSADAEGIDAGQFHKLEKLNYEGSKIKSMNLSELKSLESLTIRNSGLEQLILPEETPNLTYLYCPENKLQSINLPKDLSKLQALGLNNNNLTEIVLPAEMPALGTYTYDWGQGPELGWNPLERLVLPKSMNNVTSLYVQNTKLKELNLPEEMNSLETLWISNNPQLSDISAISYPKLLRLSARGCALSRIELGDLPEISSVDIGNNQLKEIGVNHLTTLTSLNADANMISSVTLDKLTNLTQLYLSANLITELDVTPLTRLNTLWITNNRMLYFDAPFYIENLYYGGSLYTDLSGGITIPAGMKESKIHMLNGKVAGGKLYPGEPFKNEIYYQYADIADDSSDGNFHIYDNSAKPALKSECVGIPVGETGIVTVLTPGGVRPNSWQLTWDAAVLNFEKSEEESKSEWYDGYGSYSVTTAVNYHFTRLSEGDTTVKIPIPGGETLECLVTSTAGIDNIADEAAASGKIAWDKPYDVYTIGGVKVYGDVEHLSPGIYIIRQDSTVMKISIR